MNNKTVVNKLLKIAKNLLATGALKEITYLIEGGIMASAILEDVANAVDKSSSDWEIDSPNHAVAKELVAFLKSSALKAKGIEKKFTQES